MKKSINLEFYSPEVNNKLNVWLSEEGVSAGFPSPANDFKELRISLDKVVVKNEAATFYARVVGQSMIDAGIDDGDLIVIDKSLEPKTPQKQYSDTVATAKQAKQPRESLILTHKHI